MYGYPVRKLRGGPSILALVRAPIPESHRASSPVPVETKFSPQGLPTAWIERSAAVRRLAATPARVVLMEAPAGYGKTTLAAQWRAAVAGGRPFAWLSLDDDDNDPRNLWRDIVHSVGQADRGVACQSLLRELGGDSPDITGTVLPGLINELAVLTRRITLVLDGYQVIRDRRCHEQLSFLLLHLPATVQLGLLTRSDPALPLARLRAAGELLDLRVPDLRFTPAETAALLRSRSGVTLSRTALAELGERTEGWPAAVGLAALAWRDEQAPGARPQPGARADRMVAEFLEQEVISRQPPRVQQFLVRTSILDRFCAPLCDAVLGTSAAAELLDIADRENLFLIPLDETRRWYRYHPLMAQALRGLLRRGEPELAATLHERASRWHRRAGSADEVITHAIAAGDIPGAVSLVGAHWAEYASSGRLTVVRGWLRGIGDAAIAAYPLAAHAAAWAAALSGDQESVRRWLPVLAAAAHPEPMPDGIASLQSSAALLRGVFGFEGIRAMREAADEAAKLESDPASPWYALAQVALGYSRYLTGDLAEAEDALQAAVASGSAGPMVQMISLSALALVLADLGRLAEAEQAAAAGRRLAARADLCTTPHTPLAHAASGAAHAAAGRLREARDELERAVQGQLEVPRMSPWPTVDALLRLARLQLDLGDRAAVTAPLDRARLLLTWSPEGADVLLARLDDLERRLARWSGPLSVPGPLTDRELAVLRMLRGSLRLREISAEMGVSTNTIKSHTRAIYQKLGVSARQDAILRGQEAGLM